MIKELTDSPEHIYQLMVESAPVAMVLINRNAEVIFINRAAETLFGFSSNEIEGKDIFILIPPTLVPEEKEIIKKILEGEEVNLYETVRLRKDGAGINVAVTISPIKDALGKVIGASKISLDITERKRREKEKEKRNEELIVANKELMFQNGEKEKRAAELIIANKELAFQNEEKQKRAAELISVNDELESFSYSVSHDLRAPLRAVFGYAQMVQEEYGTQLDAEGNRKVNTIMKNAKKMGQLIDDLLSFSRLGRRELQVNDIRMSHMVGEICKELNNEQSDRNIEFHIRQLLPAKADNISIKQVWLNLISNAIKYSKLKDTSVIEIGSAIEGDEIIYYIKDNGAGFDMCYADKLFGVFQRLHSDNRFEGTGVGLAIVKRIISKHKGRVWAEGKVNEGATFYFSLKKN